MARKKISEFQAKTLVFKALGLPYTGTSVTADDLEKIDELDSSNKYIVKVDEGVKKRFKQGLVKLDATPDEVKKFIEELVNRGYKQFLIEEMVTHVQNEEKYLAIERVREGKQIIYSLQGGVNIEENEESVKRVVIPTFPPHPNPLPLGERELPKKSSPLMGEDSGESETSEVHKKIEDISHDLNISFEFLDNLLQAFDHYHFSFLEINPLVILDSKFSILDLAVEVDTAGEFFAKDWNPNHFADSGQARMTDEEKVVEELSNKSQASLTYKVLNPNGSVFVLLSGGGASIVVADEVHQQGLGKELANYGEYSGNPNAEETYLYTKQLLNTLLKSNASKKVLIIGGGVANFTDIRITFNGVIKALEEFKNALKKQNLKVFVRRGGPHQEEGLAKMKEFLEKNNLYGDVQGPDMMLTDIVTEAIEYLKK